MIPSAKLNFFRVNIVVIFLSMFSSSGMADCYNMYQQSINAQNLK